MSHVAVLSGGLSLEREISLRSGERVAGALAQQGHEVTRLDLDDQLVRTIDERQFDVAFVCLHGQAGEDGTIQGLLDLLQVPYTGPGATASGLAWDKTVAKSLWAARGIATPPWVVLSASAVRDMGAADALDRVVERLGLPLMVKPAQGGAALGVKRVTDASALPGALMSAFSYHDVAIIEQHVDGTEVAVTVLDDEIFPPVEITPHAGVYDYAARYTHGATAFHVPARLDPTAREAVEHTARTAVDALGAQALVRADLIVDHDGVPWVLELDTSPGLTDTSLVPMAADAAGLGFPALCERVVQRALE